MHSWGASALSSADSTTPMPVLARAASSSTTLRRALPRAGERAPKGVSCCSDAAAPVRRNCTRVGMRLTRAKMASVFILFSSSIEMMSAAWGLMASRALVRGSTMAMHMLSAGTSAVASTAKARSNSALIVCVQHTQC